MITYDIVWSETARNQLQKIHQYYLELAGLKVAKSIIRGILLKPNILLTHPYSGQEEDNPVVKNREFRYLIEGHYKIIYNVFPENQEVLIAAVFDSRQNPDKLRV